jgi:hypothetical protein
MPLIQMEVTLLSLRCFRPQRTCRSILSPGQPQFYRIQGESRSAQSAQSAASGRKRAKDS